MDNELNKTEIINPMSWVNASKKMVLKIENAYRIKLLC